MSDMSDSKHKQLLEEGLRAMRAESKDKKIQATLDKFAGGDSTVPGRRSLSDVQRAENPYAEKRAMFRREKLVAHLTGRKFRIPFKSRSVAAFMFMPQFAMTFRHAAHLYPLFMRFLASLLVQAGLLPENHPALKYGEPGTRKTRFTEVMGDTWFRLRTMRGANFHHYGMFSLVILMVMTLTATVGAFFTRIFLGVGTASAQLFFTHPGNPYGAGVGITDMTAVNAIGPATGLYDQRLQNNGISTDYGLMVLDKILRQGAADNPSGGALQNALATMMGTYNSGITIIGSVILLWMITSIVIDTAKAGVFGGGRHNMVWAPIRVGFAALLMIPMGSGFSAGQYGVMKLAEWGSNFGTRAWSAYVNGVLDTSSLLAPFGTSNASSLVQGVTKVITCQVVYNTQLRQSQGGLPGGHRIVAKQDVAPKKMLVTNRYTNRTGSNICGTIQYSTSATTDDIDAILAGVAGTPVSAMSNSTPLAANAADYNPTVAATDFKTVALAFRKAMRGALETTLADTPNGDLGTGGATIEMARRFACRFATHRFSDGGAPPSPVAQIPNCDPGVDASLTANVTDYPDFTEQNAMQNELQTQIMNRYTGTAKPILDNYILTNMKNNMMARGWAGMGMWVQEISAMEALIDAASKPMAIVEPGTAFVPDGNAILGANWLRCGWNFITFRPCRISGQEEKTLEILSSFDSWWEETSARSGVHFNTQVNASKDMSQGSGGKMSALFKGLKDMVAGDNGILTVLVRFFIPDASDSVFLFRAVDVAATGTYPLSQLADTGHSVLGFGVLLWGTVSLVQTVSSVKGFGFSLGLGVAVGALTNLFAAIGSAMIMAGLMMSFYLPVIPLLRVSFSVLTWMISIFEAVVMVPVAALGHLVSTGDGLTAGDSQLRSVWIMWLNVLMRPVLTVMGFVGGLLIYNTFAVYFHTSFSQGAVGVMSQNPWTSVIARLAYSVIYLATLYTAANMCFKLMDVFPEHMVRWLGGSPDQTYRDLINKSDHSEVYMSRTAGTIKEIEGQVKQYGQAKASELTQREDALRNGASEKEMSGKWYDPAKKKRAQDVQDTEKTFTAKERAEYNAADQGKKNEMLADKFLANNGGKMGMLQGMGTGFTLGGRLGANPSANLKLETLFLDKNLR